MNIITIPCLSDNYAYLIVQDGSCAVVDPSEAAPVRAVLKREGLQLTHILNTHHHGDHVDGNLELKAEFGALVAHNAVDDAKVQALWCQRQLRALGVSLKVAA